MMKMMKILICECCDILSGKLTVRHTLADRTLVNYVGYRIYIPSGVLTIENVNVVIPSGKLTIRPWQSSGLVQTSFH